MAKDADWMESVSCIPCEIPQAEVSPFIYAQPGA
jgi:hypothetical protein